LHTPPDNFDPAAIQRTVMSCWPLDAGTPGVADFSVHLLLNTDSHGTVRSAAVTPEDQRKMNDPVFSALANQAINAATNYQCSTLPLPSSMLGKPQKFEFMFDPNS
jgi:hypothetical protein